MASFEKLIGGLSSPDESVQEDSLRIITNTAAEESLRPTIVSPEVIEAVARVVQVDSEPVLTMLAVWALSNLSLAGEEVQSAIAACAGFLDRLAEVLRSSDNFDLIEKALWLLTNLTIDHPENRMLLGDMRMVPLLASFLRSSSSIVPAALSSSGPQSPRVSTGSGASGMLTGGHRDEFAYSEAIYTNACNALRNLFFDENNQREFAELEKSVENVVEQVGAAAEAVRATSLQLVLMLSAFHEDIRDRMLAAGVVERVTSLLHSNRKDEDIVRTVAKLLINLSNMESPTEQAFATFPMASLLPLVVGMLRRTAFSMETKIELATFLGNVAQVAEYALLIRKFDGIAEIAQMLQKVLDDSENSGEDALGIGDLVALLASLSSVSRCRTEMSRVGLGPLLERVAGRDLSALDPYVVENLEITRSNMALENDAAADRSAAVAQALAAVAAELPPGWEVVESKSQPGTFYYRHTESGKSTWSLHEVLEDSRVVDAAPSSSQLLEPLAGSGLPLSSSEEFESIPAGDSPGKANEMEAEKREDLLEEKAISERSTSTTPTASSLSLDSLKLAASSVDPTLGLSKTPVMPRLNQLRLELASEKGPSDSKSDQVAPSAASNSAGLASGLPDAGQGEESVKPAMASGTPRVLVHRAVDGDEQALSAEEARAAAEATSASVAHLKVERLSRHAPLERSETPRRDLGLSAGTVSKQTLLRRSKRDRMLKSASIMGQDDRKSQKRSHVVQELLASEESYVVSLNTVVNAFQYPLRSGVGQALLTEEESELVFCNMEEILGLHRQLYKGLNAAFDKVFDDSKLVQKGSRVVFKQESVMIGELLKRFSLGARDAYTKYVNNFDLALQALHRFDKKAAWCKALHAIYADHGLKLDLVSYLIMPVQRMPRYRLLVEEILKHTPDSHPDIVPLQTALVNIKDTIEYVNHAKRVAENVTKMEDLAHRVTGFDVVKLGRFVLHEGVVLEKTKKNSRYLYLILFSDVLIVCERKRKNYRFIERLEYPLKVSVLEDSLHLKNAFELTVADDCVEDGRRKLTLFTMAEFDSRTWINNFKSAQDAWDLMSLRQSSEHSVSSRTISSS